MNTSILIICNIQYFKYEIYIQSFTQAEEFISAQYPVPGASIDLIRLLVDQKSPILISLNPLSDVKEVGNL